MCWSLLLMCLAVEISSVVCRWSGLNDCLLALSQHGSKGFSSSQEFRVKDSIQSALGGGSATCSAIERKSVELRHTGKLMQATGVASSAEFRDYLPKAGEYRVHAPGWVCMLTPSLLTSQHSLHFGTMPQVTASAANDTAS